MFKLLIEAIKSDSKKSQMGYCDEDENDFEYTSPDDVPQDVKNIFNAMKMAKCGAGLGWRLGYTSPRAGYLESAINYLEKCGLYQEAKKIKIPRNPNEEVKPGQGQLIHFAHIQRAIASPTKSIEDKCRYILGRLRATRLGKEAIRISKGGTKQDSTIFGKKVKKSFIEDDNEWTIDGPINESNLRKPSINWLNSDERENNPKFTLFVFLHEVFAPLLEALKSKNERDSILALQNIEKYRGGEKIFLHDDLADASEKIKEISSIILHKRNGGVSIFRSIRAYRFETALKELKNRIMQAIKNVDGFAMAWHVFEQYMNKPIDSNIAVRQKNKEKLQTFMNRMEHNVKHSMPNIVKTDGDYQMGDLAKDVAARKERRQFQKSTREI